MSAWLDVTTSVVGDEEVAERFLDVGDSIRARLRGALGRIGEEVASRAAAAAPVRTGDLRGSIHALYVETLSQQMEVVKADEVYGRFLEHGTVMHGGATNRNTGKGKRGKLSRLHELRSQGLWRIQPRPFMSPAIAAIRSQIDMDLEEAISAALAEGEG